MGSLTSHSIHRNLAGCCVNMKFGWAAEVADSVYFSVFQLGPPQLWMLMPRLSPKIQPLRALGIEANEKTNDFLKISFRIKPLITRTNPILALILPPLPPPPPVPSFLSFHLFFFLILPASVYQMASRRLALNLAQGMRSRAAPSAIRSLKRGFATPVTSPIGAKTQTTTLKNGLTVGSCFATPRG